MADRHQTDKQTIQQMEELKGKYSHSERHREITFVCLFLKRKRDRHMADRHQTYKQTIQQMERERERESVCERERGPEPTKNAKEREGERDR